MKTIELDSLCHFGIMGRRFVLNHRAVTIYEVGNIPEKVVAKVVPPFTANKQAASFSLEDEEWSSGDRKFLQQLMAMNSRGVMGAEAEIESIKNRDEGVRISPRSIVVYPTAHCNLRCTYCYNHKYVMQAAKGDGGVDVGQDDTGPVVPVNANVYTMTRETADKVLDYYFKAASANCDYNIGFFGGEPMVAFPIVKYIVENAVARAEGRPIYFHMTTNGTIAKPEDLEFLKKHQFSLIVSLDATRELHDKNRPRYKDGQGTFDVVAKNILSKYLPLNLPMRVRGTASLEEMDFEIAGRAMVELGITQFAFEPAIATTDDYDEAMMQRSLDSLERWGRAYVELLDKHPMLDFFYFTSLISRYMNLRPVVRPCHCGFASHAIAPDGTIYPCHIYVGSPYSNEWRLGSVETGIERPDLVDMFRTLTVRRRQECKDCRAALFCGGACVAPMSDEQICNAGQDYFRPSKAQCSFWKGLIQVTAWVTAELAARHPEVLERIKHTRT